MSESLSHRILAAAKQEIGQALRDLCQELGAAESSIMVSRDDAHLVFFISTNAALTGPDAPVTPINASFSGLAYRTGQSIAVADAAGKKGHFEAVDELVKMRTREFAAIPLVDRKVLGVLTLVNRAHPGDAARPFSLAELRRAETRAGDIAKALALLPGLKTGGADADLLESLGADLVADLEQLDARERGIAHSLVTALLQNRAQ